MSFCIAVYQTDESTTTSIKFEIDNNHFGMIAKSDTRAPRAETRSDYDISRVDTFMAIVDIVSEPREELHRPNLPCMSMSGEMKDGTSSNRLVDSARLMVDNNLRKRRASQRIERKTTRAHASLRQIVTSNEPKRSDLES